MWLQNYALGIALLVSLMNPARAQIGDTCSCSPTIFEFTLDFSLTCPPVNVTVGTGIAQTSCIISNLAPNPEGDRIPVEVFRIQFFELGLDSRILARKTESGPFADGAVVDYTSITAEPITDEEMIPSALQMTLNGRNSDGETILNTWVLQYTNACDVEPILFVGNSAGWAVMTDLVPPRGYLCPAVDTSAPTDSPDEPTDAPVDPTDAPVDPTDAPVDPTDAPVAPTDAPDEPTDAPVAPVIPTDGPVPTEPTSPSPTPVSPMPSPTTKPPSRPEPTPDMSMSMSFSMSHDYFGRLLELNDDDFEMFEFGRRAER